MWPRERGNKRYPQIAGHKSYTQAGAHNRQALCAGRDALARPPISAVMCGCVVGGVGSGCSNSERVEGHVNGI